MKKTRYHSYKLGKLPKGCRLCVKGAKLVLFITGLCPRSCYYCPISDKKYKKDVMYADEWPIEKMDDMVREATLIKAKGAGITGGDPLAREFRTLVAIKRLKHEFGKKFHIHLYTSPDLINESVLKNLYEAGLDEIRFHLDLDNRKLWKKIKLAKHFGWKVGVEIPVIPIKYAKIRKVIDFLSKINIDFLNLNELEIADNQANKLLELGHKPKNELSYAVKGSEEVALSLLEYSKGKIKNVHYCTATLKDRVQLAERIKRRAKSVKKPFDRLNSDGTLTRGAIYLEKYKPSFGYNEKLKGLPKKKKDSIIKKLQKIRDEMKKDFKIKYLEVDEERPRLLTGVKEVKKIRHEVNKMLFLNWMKHEHILKSKKELTLAIVREYPTYDSIIIDLEFL